MPAFRPERRPPPDRPREAFHFSRATCFVAGLATGMVAQPLIPIIAAGAVLSVASTWLVSEALEHGWKRYGHMVPYAAMQHAGDKAAGAVRAFWWKSRRTG